MAPNGGANVMRFGAFSTGPGQYWPGTLDDASFYPAVLTPSQVQAHYDARYTRQPGDVRRDRNRHHQHRHRAVEYGAAGGVGCGAAGADVDCVDGIVVGDGADLLRLPVAAL